MSNDAAYSGDPCSSPKDELRFLIPDTCEPYHFSDKVLDYFLKRACGDTLYAAICAVEQVIAELASCPDAKIGKTTINNKQVFDMWCMRLEKLKAKHEESGGNLLCIEIDTCAPKCEPKCSGSLKINSPYEEDCCDPCEPGGSVFGDKWTDLC